LCESTLGQWLCFGRQRAKLGGLEHRDVVIVGGGPAGISTALFLVHAAPELRERVVVLEKARYPREKYCAGAIARRGERLLASIGLSVGVDGVPIDGIAFRSHGRTTVMREPGAARVVRRLEFDHALANAARARGVIVLDGEQVSAVRPLPSCVELEATTLRLRCRVLVGADGVGSFVRRALGFSPLRLRAQAIEVDTDPVNSDEQRDLLRFDTTNRKVGYYWDFPTKVAGHGIMCRGVYRLALDDGTHRRDLEQQLDAELAQRGLKPSAYTKKRYAECGFDPGGLLAVPRCLLVGEAAGIDPVTGEGIAQAISYGHFAGRYLADKLRRHELGFSDYRERFSGSSIGRDLLVRVAALELIYGRHRPATERLLHDVPDILRLGLRHFAGEPMGVLTTARTAGTVAARACFEWLRPGQRGDRR
jgi:flavin-dependent dehydrogenase